MKNYEKKYKEALEIVRSEYQTHKSFNGFCEMLARIFPELKESEDMMERNKKVKMSLMQYISELNKDVVHLHPGIETCNEWLAWLEKQDVNVTNIKTEWSPSKKQMESLIDLLKYNIGVFDYQKFMEVKSLYDDLTKIVNYETT